MSESESTAAAPKKRASGRAKRVSKVPADAELDLRWRLADLPSSQHRAGLAALVLLVDWASRAKKAGRVLEILDLTSSGCRLRANREGLRDLFDAAYGARVEEQVVKTKWPGQEPVRTIEIEVAPSEPGDSNPQARRSRAPKREKRFVYEVVVPTGAFLSEWEPVEEGEAARPWLKLWRDFVWGIMRGVPAQRAPFIARASSSPCTEDADEVFDELFLAPHTSVDLPSTYFLGAQQFTAESVSFRDRAATQFLLHFWPYAAALYQPISIDRDGQEQHSGFAVAIPDVADLLEFVSALPQVMKSRAPERAGYRPRGAIVDIVAEAGVDLLYRMRGRVAAREGAGDIADLVLAVDVIHCEKEGNNVRVRSTLRLLPKREIGDRHERIRKRYWNPRFRRQRILNLLDEQPWWHGFGRVISTIPHKQVFDEKSYWSRDARAAFDKQTGETAMNTDVNAPATIEEIVLRTVNIYLGHKLEAKHALRWEGVQGTSKETEYREKKEKLATDAFLAIRARTGGDFVSYFTGTLCSVPQRMSESAYLSLSRALIEDTEKVRTLTMLALSARA